MDQDKLSYSHCEKGTEAKEVFMEHLRGNNIKKACAFTMQHLLILNILRFILMLLDACFSF